MKKYAGLWERVRAFAIDYLVILIYMIIATLLFLLVNAISNISEWLFADRVRAQTFAFFLVTVPVTLYFAISESSIKQSTWGKRRLQLKITDLNGDRISFWRAFRRTLVKFIPWELSHTLLWEIYFSQGMVPILVIYGYALVYLLIGLNVASLVLSLKKQTLYDLLAGTYIIRQHHQ